MENVGPPLTPPNKLVDVIGAVSLGTAVDAGKDPPRPSNKLVDVAGAVLLVATVDAGEDL